MKTTFTWLTTLLMMKLGASQAALYAADAGSPSSSLAQQAVPVGQRHVSVTVDLGQFRLTRRTERDT